jgi:hypothetical protein
MIDRYDVDTTKAVINFDCHAHVQGFPQHKGSQRAFTGYGSEMLGVVV